MKNRAFVRYTKKGKLVPGSLIVTAGSYPQGPSVWKEVAVDYAADTTTSGNYSKTLDFNLEDFKDNLGTDLDSCHLYIRSKIPNINFFYDEGDNNMIDDGGRDMYDTGNAINTNFTQLYADIKEDELNSSLNIPYTHTQADNTESDMLYATPPMDGIISDSDDYFGIGSRYFTNMYPGLFILAATGLSGVTEFSIGGNLGSDGWATDFYYKQPTSYAGWTAYCKTNKDYGTWGDPTVNHIILVKGPNTSTTQTGDTGGDWDDHAIQNLTDDNTDIIYLLFSTMTGTPAPTKAELRVIADAVLEVAAGTDPCND